MNIRNLSRRQFFAVLAAGGVVTASGLWMPGEKLISIFDVVSGNRLLTIDQITREALRILQAKVNFFSAFTTAGYDQMWPNPEELSADIVKFEKRIIYPAIKQFYEAQTRQQPG